MEQRFLSREEEVELARSNKKVKDVHHVEFTLSQGVGLEPRAALGDERGVKTGISF